MLRLRFQRSRRLFFRICFRLPIGAGDSCAGSRARNSGHSECAVVPHRPDTFRRVAGDRHGRFRVSARMFCSWLFVAIWYRALSGLCGYCDGRLARRPQGIFSASGFVRKSHSRGYSLPGSFRHSISVSSPRFSAQLRSPRSDPSLLSSGVRICSTSWVRSTVWLVVRRLSCVYFGSAILFACDQPGDARPMLMAASYCAGFLTVNWPRAKIFMGDVGSTALGFLLVAVPLVTSLSSPAQLLR
jgi:hypothetical protein